MSEDNVYKDAEIVWVKLRSCWWPGEVCSNQRQPEGLLKHTKRKPYCVVKFFQEDSFEYVKNAKMIYPFNCSKKDEFIRKGHALLAKNKYMEQFPAAVSTAERLTRSVTRSSLFFNSRPDSIIKAILTDSPPQSERTRNERQCEIVDKILKKTNSPAATTQTTITSGLSPIYKCTMCEFQSTRQNVLVLHRRSHSGSGSRPQRNSLVSRSIINTQNTKQIQISSETIIDREIKGPNEPIKNVLQQTTSEIENENIKTLAEQHKSEIKEQGSKDNNVCASTIFIRPPPKKQLNFINCKSENIQKSLLADWIDEDRDEDDEIYNTDAEKNAKQIEVTDTVTSLRIENQYSAISVSTENSPSRVAVDQKTSSVLNEQKPTSKIRNIPKKDRRNIVFNDFHQNDDISLVESQSQKATMDIYSLKTLQKVNEYENAEKSSLDSQIVESLTPKSLSEKANPLNLQASEDATNQSRNKARPDVNYSSCISEEKNQNSYHQDKEKTPEEASSSDFNQHGNLNASSPVIEKLVAKKPIIKEHENETSVENSKHDLWQLEKLHSLDGTSKAIIRESTEVEQNSVVELESTEPTSIVNKSQPTELEFPEASDSTSEKSTEFLELPLETKGTKILISKESSIEEGSLAESSPYETNSCEQNNNENTLEPGLVQSVEPESIGPTIQLSVAQQSTFSVEVDSAAHEIVSATEENNKFETNSSDFTPVKPSLVEDEDESINYKNITNAKASITSDEPMGLGGPMETDKQNVSDETVISKEQRELTAVEESMIEKELNEAEDSITSITAEKSIVTQEPMMCEKFSTSKELVLGKLTVENDLDLLESSTIHFDESAATDIEESSKTTLQIQNSSLNAVETDGNKEIEGNQNEVRKITTEHKTLQEIAPDSILSIKSSFTEYVADDSILNNETDCPGFDFETTEKRGNSLTSDNSPQVKPSVSDETEEPTTHSGNSNSSRMKPPNTYTSNKLHKEADTNKFLNERKISLRSSKSRECTKTKEILLPKESIEFSVKMNDEILNNCNKGQLTIVSSVIQQKTNVLTDQHVSIQGDEKEYDEELSIKETTKTSVIEGKECSSPISPENEQKLEPENNTQLLLDEVPVFTELEDSKADLDSNEMKPRSSFSKASLACFDFNEEEDILTSIANFKKTYVSPEKNYNFSVDSATKSPDAQNLELEMKDRQLSAEIESLLKTTELPVKITASSTPKPLFNEVSGLPIKERGKRIFKSRNRFRVETDNSVPKSTTTESRGTGSSDLALNSSDNVPMEKDKISECELSTEKQNEDETNYDIINKNIDRKMNDKTEEEIINRIVFSPTEVFATNNDVESNEPNEPVQSGNLVSSSEINIQTSSRVKNDDKEDEIGSVDNESEPYTAETQERPKMQNDDSSATKEINNLNAECVRECGRRVSQQIEINNVFAIDSSTDVQVDVTKLAELETRENVDVTETKEPVESKQLSVDEEEEIDKVNDSICESTFEYELVTTEVTTIVDNIPNEDHTKESSAELLEEVVSCCDDGTFLNEMIIADVIDSQSSVAENEIDNSNETLRNESVAEAEDVSAIENPNKEPNSCSITDINDSDVYNDIQVSNEKEERSVTCGEQIDAFSDDSSTIISDAEAEFGSPTSMLDDERIFNRTRSGSDTPAVSTEGKVHKSTKKFNRKPAFGASNKDNKLRFQSPPCDTQESTSDDIANETVNNAVEEISCPDKSIESALPNNQTDLQENENFLQHKGDPISNEKEVDSNYESSDSSDEEEEEICSPPIESLIDDDTEADTIQNHSDATSLPKTKNEQVDIENKTVNDSEFNVDEKNMQTSTDDFCGEENDKKTNTFYTIIQKSDTKIKLNKQKDTSSNEEIVNGWTETSADVRKSELAGEELTAAEALLLIPKQATNALKSSDKTSNEQSERKSTPSDFKDEIKYETLESCETVITEDLDQCTEGDSSKDFRRKRRSHMKVTPRKRVIEEVKVDEKNQETTEAKIPKLTDSEFPATKSSDCFEDNFVLNYMKEQLADEIDSFESIDENAGGNPEKTEEKHTPEKVHITVDISNPLSSQIATILGTNRSAEVPHRSGDKKRKMSVEEDIPSFIIKRPCPKTIAEEEAADRETIAQLQNLCPQVEITRKSSKDDQSPSISSPQKLTTNTSTVTKPQIINQQILRTGNQSPIITVTAKCNKNEENIFDISNMPIVLSNDKIVNEKVHLVITPTTNPQIIKQLQNQHQQLLSNTGASISNFSGNATVNVTTTGITTRRSSGVRVKRSPSIQQQTEQQDLETHSYEIENFNQEINFQQQPSQLPEYVHSNQKIHNQHQMQPEQTQFQQLHQQNTQVQTHHQFQQQLPQQQNNFQQHQIQQQLQEEQNILMQQHQQILLQQQHQQQQLQLSQQQQLVANEKATQSNQSEKQIGIDNRGNKYVIIRHPSNTAVKANNSETSKFQQQRITVPSEQCDQVSQRKQKQKKQSPLTVQVTVTSATSQVLSVTSSQPSQPNQYYKEQQNLLTNIPVMPTTTSKPKGRGRGRPPKNKTDIASTTNKQSTPSNNGKTHTNGRRSSGRICEPPRQRSSRLQPVTTSSDVQQSAMDSTTTYISSPQQQQTQSIGFMIDHQFSPIEAGSSQNIRLSTEPHQTQIQELTMSPQSTQQTTSELINESSEVSGGGYAVPSLPVPGYPQTYLLCELIGNKYKEVFPKPLYLSPDRTRFLEVPDELVTEAHKKLSDSRREPNPNALKIVSDGSPHILQSRLIEIDSENIVNQDVGNNQQNELLMQKHQQLSVEEQASALLCLQEQLNQEQLAVRDQLVQEQFVEEQFVQEQYVQEQFVPEQFVQEQFVQEQFVQEQFVQEQFVQEQFVQEQFVQEQFNLQPQQFSLQLARFETGEVIEDAERGQMMVVTTGTHNLILDDKSFFEFTGEKRIDFYNAEKDTYILTPQVISNLLHHYALGNITAVPAMNTEIADHQQDVSIADVIQNTDSSTNILEVALDDSGLYTEEQFINSGEILQIETAEGMQLIGTAADNTDMIFHHMAKANTNETNVLLNQGPKMSAIEIPSDKSKRRFETKPSTPATLEDCLNVIGVPIQSPSIPTSLELPASVTNPAIVAKTRTPTPGTITMNEIIATGLCHHPDITSLPSMSSNDQELSYEFFPSNTEAIEDKDQISEESVVTDMGEYSVVTSSASFDDPAR